MSNSKLSIPPKSFLQGKAATPTVPYPNEPTPTSQAGRMLLDIEAEWRLRLLEAAALTFQRTLTARYTSPVGQNNWQQAPPWATWADALLINGGVGGAGGGSAALTGGVANQIGGAGGSCGAVTRVTFSVTPGGWYIFNVGAGGKGGAGGAASTGAAGNQGAGSGQTVDLTHTFIATNQQEGPDWGTPNRSNWSATETGVTFPTPANSGALTNTTLAVGIPDSYVISDYSPTGLNSGLPGRGSWNNQANQNGGLNGCSGGGAGLRATATAGGAGGYCATSVYPAGVAGGIPAGQSVAPNGLNGGNGASPKGLNNGCGGGGGGGGAPGGAGGNGGDGSEGLIIITWREF